MLHWAARGGLLRINPTHPAHTPSPPWLCKPPPPRHPYNRAKPRRQPHCHALQQEQAKNDKQYEKTTPAIVLMFASAALWGSNPVALRYVFTSAITVPSPAAMTVIHTGLAALLLYLTAAWTGRVTKDDWNGTPPPTTQQTVPTLHSLLNWAPATMHMAAIELGILAAVANAITVFGFQHSPATHGAFLFRLSAGLTPMIAYLAGDTLRANVWLAGALALGGSLLLAMDGAAAATSTTQVTQSTIQQGDVALMLAAFLWSIHIVRVGRHTARFKPLPLAIYQLAITAAASCVLLALQCIMAPILYMPLPSLWPVFNTGPSTSSSGVWLALGAWLAWLYPALGPWAGGTWLQFQSQSRNVRPAVTSIILSTDPLWTALFAWLFLGAAEQHLGVYGVAGAVCIVIASLLAGGD